MTDNEINMQTIQLENNFESSNTLKHKRIAQVKPVQYVHNMIYVWFSNQMENNLKSSNTVNHKRMSQVNLIQYVHNMIYVIRKSNGKITSSPQIPLIYPVSTYAIL